MAGRCIGGAEGDRTPDLVIANDALSQLSYCPNTLANFTQVMRQVKESEPCTSLCSLRCGVAG